MTENNDPIHQYILGEMGLFTKWKNPPDVLGDISPTICFTLVGFDGACSLFGYVDGHFFPVFL